MKGLAKYTKILTLGSSKTENALKGKVVIQEKMDGSLMRWGVDEDRTFWMGSKNCLLHCAEENKMFAKAVNYLLSKKEWFEKALRPNTYLFAEFLNNPKHNVLQYEKVPTNNLVLFDIMCNGKWNFDRRTLDELAYTIGIDVIPELYRGKADVNKIKELLTTPSYLGKQLVEGVVIKNYKEFIFVGNNTYPLFTKYVREEYKEKQRCGWTGARHKLGLDDFIRSFKSEPRWQKAIQHLKEEGRLTNSPKDIGELIKEVQKDIAEEEKDNIIHFLYRHYIKDILRVSTQGFVEWYKNKLLESLEND